MNKKMNKNKEIRKAELKMLILVFISGLSDTANDVVRSSHLVIVYFYLKM